MTDVPNLGNELTRLEDIVRQLEAEDLPIEKALELFEEGVKRLRDAKSRLTAAETKVQQVLRDNSADGTVRLEPLDG